MSTAPKRPPVSDPAPAALSGQTPQLRLLSTSGDSDPDTPPRQDAYSPLRADEPTEFRSARRRAIWHQRLIDAEGGYRVGLRADSTLFVHLFAASLIVTTGILIEFQFLEWMLAIGCIAAVIVTELLNASVQILAAGLRETQPLASRQTSRLATAGTLTTIIVATILCGLLITRAVWRLFA